MNAPKTPAALPQIGESLDGGKYVGLLTDKEGQPYLLVLLPDQASDIKWQPAMDWADGLKATLPNRIEAAMLFQHLRSDLREEWHWTNETAGFDASHAWYCYFCYGLQYSYPKSSDGSAVAVRRLPLQSFNPLGEAKRLTAEGAAKLRAAAQQLLAACDSAEEAAGALEAA
jgi:hypothetical protein